MRDRVETYIGETPKTTNKKSIQVMLNKTTQRMMNRPTLKPLDTSTRMAKEMSQASPLKGHMEQLSSILGEDFGSAFSKTATEPMSAGIIFQTPKVTDKSYGSIMPHSVLHKKLEFGTEIEEAQEELEADASNPVSPRNSHRSPRKGSLQVDRNKSAEMDTLNQDQIDDINFISILMYVDGEDKGVNVANDRQFGEICKLMDEYYGINEKKILNKYEVWKKYIQNLKMKKNFDERSREGELTHNSESEKTESKDYMVQRYSAFLSKKWFSKADPFLRAKYKEYFQGSEVKWGPNMVYKRLAQNTAHLKQIKGLMEQRLNKEVGYVNNRIKVDSYTSPKKRIENSSKSVPEEGDYDKFIRMKHKDSCKYCALNEDHEHPSDSNLHESIKHELRRNASASHPVETPNSTKLKNLKLLPKLAVPRNPAYSGLKKLHHKVSSIGEYE